MCRRRQSGPPKAQAVTCLTGRVISPSISPVGVRWGGIDRRVQPVDTFVMPDQGHHRGVVRAGRGHELDRTLGLADQMTCQAADGQARQRRLLFPGVGHLCRSHQLRELVNSGSHCGAVESSNEGERHAEDSARHSGRSTS